MSKVKYFEHNKIGVDYLVGDLHGCLDELNLMLDHVKFDKSKDRLFSVGDLVDRGPNSLGCAELIYEPWFHCVQGNHEQMMIMGLKSHHSENHWLANGGAWYHDVDIQLLNALAEDFAKLPLVIVIGKFEKERINIVHAELINNSALKEPSDEDIDNWFFNSINEDSMVWGRQIINYKPNGSRSPALSTVYAGHTPIPDLREIHGHRFIDGGAVFWDRQKYEMAKLNLIRIKDGRAFSLLIQENEIIESNPWG